MPITALGFGATAVTILGVGWVTILLLPHIGWPAFRVELLRAQRDRLEELYRKCKISDEIRRTIARSLDTQEPRPFG